VPSGAPDWKLDGFLDRVDSWVERECPSNGLRVVVLDWIMTRFADPYREVYREPSLPNLWYGPVPGTDADGSVVVCSYWIEEATSTVHCCDISTLDLTPHW